MILFKKKQKNQKRTKIKGKKVKHKAQGELLVWLFLIALLMIGVQTSHDTRCLMTNTDVPESLNQVTQNEQIIILKH